MRSLAGRPPADVEEVFDPVKFDALTEAADE
jgi:hypothetical protein